MGLDYLVNRLSGYPVIRLSWLSGISLHKIPGFQFEISIRIKFCQVLSEVVIMLFKKLSDVSKAEMQKMLSRRSD